MNIYGDPSQVMRILLPFLTLLIFSTQTVFPYAVEINFWKRRGQVLSHQDLTPSSAASLGEGAIPVPLKILPKFSQSTDKKIKQDLPPWITSLSLKGGRIQAIDKSHSPFHIIHIQDVHLNQEAQENIATLLQEFVESRNIGVIGLEGGLGSFDYTDLRDPNFLEARRDLGNYFLKEGQMDGPSYVGLTSPSTLPPVIGVDHKESYLANIEAYRRAESTKETLLTWLQNKEKENEQKKITLSPPLKNLDQLITSYHKGSIPLSTYLNGLDSAGFLMMEQFLSAYELESNINEQELNRERTHLIERLVLKLTKEEQNDFQIVALQFRTGTISYR